MAVDAGLVELTVQVVFEATDDNVGIHGQDCDERGLGIRAAAAPEQDVNLQHVNDPHSGAVHSRQSPY